jgi:hypothetical protein
MSIVINPNLSTVALQGTTSDVVLQPGSVIQAKVLALLGSDQVRIAIGGQSIEVQTQAPLQAGQTLQLAVSQTPDGIRLAVVNQQSSAAVGNAVASNAAALDSVTLAPQAIVISTPAPSAAAATNLLTPQEAVAVSTAAQLAATQQNSLSPLFADLAVASQLSGLPPKLQAAVAQLLAQRPNLDSSLTGSDIKQAFQRSGLFLEASLATGSIATGPPDLKASLIVLRQVLATALDGVAGAQTTTPTASALASVSQEKAAQRIQLAAQALASAQAGLLTAESVELPTVASPALTPTLTSASRAPVVTAEAAVLAALSEAVAQTPTSQTAPTSTPASTADQIAARAAASSAALNALQEAVQANSSAIGTQSRLVLDNSVMLSLVPGVTNSRLPIADEGEFARSNLPPPPIAGALPTAQAVMPATLVAHAPVEATLHHLLTETDGALARQTLLQVASLPDRGDGAAARTELSQPRWNFEIPFATPHGTAIAQFEISRDADNAAVEPSAKRVWRARFSLDVEPAGPVHALVSLAGDKTSVRIWAERPSTAAQLRADTAQLSQALARAELQPGDIVVRDGAPTQPAAAPAGHFLDRAL